MTDRAARPATDDDTGAGPHDGHPADADDALARGSSGGRLVLAATPIGNTDDASARLRALLAEADVVAAEDTRRLRALAARLGVEVRGRVVSHHEHNEAERSAELLDVVAGGGTVVVVTDAGMPAVSDPGFRVVTAAVAAGVTVTAAPGPSAVLTALALSGLPTDRFCFEGFLPRKPGERARALALLADERRTMVFFEAPHRLDDVLDAMVESFGADRPAAVCRELTKTYEEVRRGPVADLAAWARDGQVRGEIVVVVGGAGGPAKVSTADLVAEVLSRADAGERLKDVVAEVATAAGMPKRDLYAAALAARTR
ncbi:16S rRNA (cytidine(1402)-2'-O)-methyltransferase [Cellulomonas biazotea]|uniref:16S rRNA (cytidine(1402)-2'-O)-methyltransferase n=1 Tax=Cellulomonas biazotea TaxID=1709 RepID=UPI0010302928